MVRRMLHARYQKLSSTEGDQFSLVEAEEGKHGKKLVFTRDRLISLVKVGLTGMSIWGAILLLVIEVAHHTHIRPLRRAYILSEHLPVNPQAPPPLNEEGAQGCALLFFGLPRNFKDFCLPSIRKHILEHNKDCDIFVHTYNKTSEGGSLGGAVNPGDVFELANNVVMDTEAEFQTARDLSYYRQFFPNPTTWNFPVSMDNMIRQWHSLDRVWGLMKKKELARKKNYKQVGYFRLDVQYQAPLNIYSGDAVIPKERFDRKTSINDRMFFGKRSYAEVWGTQRFPNVGNYIAEQEKWLDSLSPWTRWSRIITTGLHSEQYVYYIVNNVGRIPAELRDVCFMRVRSSGQIEKRDCDSLTYKAAQTANL